MICIFKGLTHDETTPFGAISRPPFIRQRTAPVTAHEPELYSSLARARRPPARKPRPQAKCIYKQLASLCTPPLAALLRKDLEHIAVGHGVLDNDAHCLAFALFEAVLGGHRGKKRVVGDVDSRLVVSLVFHAAARVAAHSLKDDPFVAGAGGEIEEDLERRVGVAAAVL